MSREAEHAAFVASLREQLGVLRLQGGISDQFVDWHRRFAACAEAITKDVPSCANLCSELMSIDFEMPSEFAASMSEELRDHHRIMATAAKTFFRSKCGEADEILYTLMIALRQTGR
jgi:hypothetical protein